jgi:hypothetical protein
MFDVGKFMNELREAEQETRLRKRMQFWLTIATALAVAGWALFIAERIRLL